MQAAIDSLPCLREWEIGLIGHDTVAACSASAGAVFRGTGNLDWQGKAVGYGLPAKYPGDLFTFTGSDRDGQGWESSADGAIVTNVKVSCPISSGRHIYHEITFKATGSLAKGAYSASDATDPNPLSSKGLALHVDSSAVSGVEYWVLNIKANETDPSFQSHNSGWPRRDAGNIDASVVWSQTFDAASQLPTVNTFYLIEPYTSSTLKYEMQWGQVLASPAKYDIEGKKSPGKAEYIRAVCSAHFSGYKDGVGGYLRKPGATDIWP